MPSLHLIFDLLWLFLSQFFLTMDTDDLSQEAYKSIMIEAERFNHDLTLRFGVLSRDCNDEEEYLKKISTTDRKNKKS